MEELEGKVAFVTGGAGGIGLGIARACAAEGMKVAVVDVDEARLHDAVTELSKTIDAFSARLDVRDRDAFASVADAAEAALGPVALLCNNAGVTGQSSVHDLSYEAWDWTMAVNLDGPFNGIATFLPRMLARGGGAHIVNTASSAGLFGNIGFVYAASKYGVVGLSEALRIELKRLDVGISVLCPNGVATDIIANSIEASSHLDGGIPPGMQEHLEKFVDLLAEGAQPDDVGRMVLEAVKANRLFVMTDDYLAPWLEKRTAAIIAAMPASGSASG